MLVHVDASSHARRRVVLALQLARRHGAALAGAYWSGPLGGVLPLATAASPAAVAGMMEAERDRCIAARAMFEAACAASGGPWRWVGERSLAATAGLVRQALYADLLVLGQRDPQESAMVGPDSGFVPDLVVSSGKPALVLPHACERPRLGRSVAIAWKECPEAARAVAAALPLLQAAANVHVLTWNSTDDGYAFPTGEPGLDLRSWLEAHGVAAQWHAEPGEPRDLGELLLSRIADLDADVLVMGLYGHNRAREFLLGGVSRTILASMTVPVLMSH